MPNIKGTIKGAAIGAPIGAALGAAFAPYHALCDITAPVSYPIHGVLAGVGIGIMEQLPARKVVVCGVVGGAVGTLCILKAPWNLINRPLQPLYGAIGGAIAGGMIGNEEL